MYLKKPKRLIIWNRLSNFPILLQPRNSSKQTLLLMIYIEKRVNFSGGHWTCTKISSRSRYLQSAQAHTWTCIWLTSRSKPSPPAPGGTTWTARWFTKCKKPHVLLHFLICSHHFCPTSPVPYNLWMDCQVGSLNAENPLYFFIFSFAHTISAQRVSCPLQFVNEWINWWLKMEYMLTQIWR